MLFQVLHYLGLDHVGHIGGRNSVLMGPKLKEMDDVVKMIHMNTKQSEDNDQGRTLVMVVSDHGMTNNGNHGGSTYDETDSLVLFVDLKQETNDFPVVSHSMVDQVDIAPTLALLFGVPIPKNNVGILISEAFGSLTELANSRHQDSSTTSAPNFVLSRNMFCTNPGSLKESPGGSYLTLSNNRYDYSNTVLAYDDFLRAASKWLSRRTTHKPAGLLASGVAAMVLSCMIFTALLFWLDQEVYLFKTRRLSDTNKADNWQFDETYVLAIIFIIVLSMGSSSMVEEEQYIWHFLTSTFYLVLLRKTIQSLREETRQSLIASIEGQNRSCIQICCIVLILITGRILRGWHQGGVNWAHLPDISKWLEQDGRDYLKPIQLVSWFLVTSLGLYSLLLRSKKYFVMVIGATFLFPGVLVLQQIIFELGCFTQIVYALLAILTLGAVSALPWLMPFPNPMIFSNQDTHLSNSFFADIGRKSLLIGFRDFMYVVGWAYVHCWCLLQLLLQRPTNAMPVLLLLVQILASICYCSNRGLHLKQWVEVAGLYYLGMAGHFALGNTNTLATIDVAGAFIGISSHSTLLSGILMFIITYASPLLAFLSMVMYMSMKEMHSAVNPQDEDIWHFLKTTVGFPCLVPLGLNSVLLVAYTIVLLLMRNHLFVWSVFSPKYLYVCATTACVYIGVSVVSLTAVYGFLVSSLRSRALHCSIRDDSSVSMVLQ
ncbi:hypothetical protein U1Q18_048013 [Sarracenia purpurea var. burkii]